MRPRRSCHKWASSVEHIVRRVALELCPKVSENAELTTCYWGSMRESVP